MQAQNSILYVWKRDNLMLLTFPDISVE